MSVVLLLHWENGLVEQKEAFWNEPLPSRPNCYYLYLIDLSFFFFSSPGTFAQNRPYNLDRVAWDLIWPIRFLAHWLSQTTHVICGRCQRVWLGMTLVTNCSKNRMKLFPRSNFWSNSRIVVLWQCCGMTISWSARTCRICEEYSLSDVKAR